MAFEISVHDAIVALLGSSTEQRHPVEGWALGHVDRPRPGGGVVTRRAVRRAWFVPGR